MREMVNPNSSFEPLPLVGRQMSHFALVGTEHLPIVLFCKTRGEPREASWPVWHIQQEWGDVGSDLPEADKPLHGRQKGVIHRSPHPGARGTPMRKLGWDIGPEQGDGSGGRWLIIQGEQWHLRRTLN